MGADQVLSIARQQIGKPYVFGAAGPNTFDCSGLVVYCFKNGAGKTLPHYTGSLIVLGTSVSKSQLAPGDLVFPDSGHVQIYSGNGNIIEAPHTGANVREVKMWGFWQARRIIPPGTGNAGSTSAQTVDYNNVSNPLIPESVQRAAAYIGDPAVWRKLGYYLLGAILILGAAYILFEGEIGKVIPGNLVSGAKSAVKNNG